MRRNSRAYFHPSSGGHSKQMAICKPGSVLTRTPPWSLRLWDTLPIKPCTLWCLVKAAGVDEHASFRILGSVQAIGHDWCWNYHPWCCFPFQEHSLQAFRLRPTARYSCARFQFSTCSRRVGPFSGHVSRSRSLLVTSYQP